MYTNGSKKIKNKESEIEYNEKLLEAIIDTIPNPIFYKNTNGYYIYSNKAHLDFLGLKKEDIIGSNIYDILPKETAKEHDKIDRNLLKNKKRVTYDSKLENIKGLVKEINVTKDVFTNKRGESLGIVGVILDITERKKARERINRLLKIKDAMLEITHGIIGTKNISELYDLILEKVFQTMKNADVACVLILDNENNLKIEATRGYNKVKSKDFSVKLKDSFTWKKTKGNIEKTIIIEDIQDMLIEQVPDIIENDLDIIIRSSLSAPIIIDGQLYGLLNVDSCKNNIFDEIDIELMENMRSHIEIAIEKHRLYEQNLYLSRYDNLTNIYNRRYFEELFEKKLKESNESFLLVIFDINGLKIINDTNGHLAGDKLIKTFTEKMKNEMKNVDIFARYGGDEFIAIFFDINVRDLKLKFENLSKYFHDNPITFEGDKFKCSFSYGISSFTEDSDDYNGLVKIADERMYIYKKRLKSNKVL
ncbi:MAG: diguanylate cyclase [Firmicutes bacterium]|nr:diguanylate cyclase [Bacillota bacterium]